MKVLFDQGTPVPLRQYLTAHDVATAHELGWGALKNGDLLRLAEAQGYEVLVTTDSHLKYQQNLKGRKIAIVVLLSTRWPRIRGRANEIAACIAGMAPGDFAEIAI